MDSGHSASHLPPSSPRDPPHRPHQSLKIGGCIKSAHTTSAFFTNVEGLGPKANEIVLSGNGVHATLTIIGPTHCKNDRSDGNMTCAKYVFLCSFSFLLFKFCVNFLTIYFINIFLPTCYMNRYLAENEFKIVFKNHSFKS